VWISPLIALLVFASGVGFIGGTGTATSRLPFVAGVDGLLPKAFGKVHPRWGTPWVATLALAVASTILLVMYQLGDSMRAAFDELVSMMVITGFIPYLYIFGSAWKAGKRLSAISGTAIMVIALLCSVVPPTEITNVWLYEGKILAGTVAVLGSAWLVYRRGRKASPTTTRH
jgi:amino acid transporter